MFPWTMETANIPNIGKDQYKTCHLSRSDKNVIMGKSKVLQSGIFEDFTKAFYSVPHRILLLKLQAFSLEN